MEEIKKGIDVFIADTAIFKRPNIVVIGDHVAIDHGAYFTTELRVGDYVHIAPYVTGIGGAKSKIIVGNFATIAAGSRLIAGSDTFSGKGFTSTTVPEEYRDEVVYSTINIEDFAGIGTNVIIMPGVKIGQGSVVGANSFVNKDTEPWTFYAGSPAKPIKIRPKEKMIEYAKKLGYYGGK